MCESRKDTIKKRGQGGGFPFWLTERVFQFTEVCQIGESVFWERGLRYGDATKPTGLLGAVVTMVGDMARLRNLVLNQENLAKLAENDPDVVEAVRDALIDIHNYTGIAAHWLDEGNIMGEAR